MPKKKAKGGALTKEAGKTADKFRLDAFVNEFLVDWNAAAAAARIGTPGPACRKVGKMLVANSYVSARLNERLAEMAEFDIISRNQVFAGLLREANDPSNSGFERVKAWEVIGKMKGMNEAPKKVGDDVPKSGVLLLPGITTLVAWEAESKASQDALRIKAREQAARVIVDV